MVSKRKVRLMTQLSIFETRTGKDDIRLSKFYQSDYARFNVLKTAVMTTLGFLCVLGLVAFYNLEFLLENALNIDYIALGWKVLGIYIGVMAVYLIFALFGYSFKYRLSRKKLGKYYKMLGRLKEIVDEENEGINIDEYEDENEGE